MCVAKIKFDFESSKENPSFFSSSFDHSLVSITFFTVLRKYSTSRIAAAPAAIAKSKELDAARAQLELAKQAANAGPEAELRAAVEANPNDHQARYDLAAALLAAGNPKAAVDELLELFRRDREWNGGAAKTQLFTIFDALKPQDPIVLAGRRRLSSMIFA